MANIEKFLKEFDIISKAIEKTHGKDSPEFDEIYHRLSKEHVELSDDKIYSLALYECSKNKNEELMMNFFKKIISQDYI